ncbi:MAG: AI-2E family transporter [Campylobacter sp.]|nr:AI-2E family transporter [Campylobacter sp.]
MKINTSKMFLLVCIFFVFSWVIYLFKSFWMTITIGFLLSISTSIFYNRVLKLTNHREILSALIVTLAFCLMFLLPLAYAITQIAIHSSAIDIAKITEIFNKIRNYQISLPSAFEFLEPKIQGFLESINIAQIAKEGLGYLSKIGKGSLDFFIDICLIIVFFFFSHLLREKIANFISDQTPMKENQLKLITEEVTSTMSVVFYSTISNSIMQGALFGIIVSFFGYDGFLMGIIYAFASLLPVVGGTIVYFPIGIYEYLNGNTLGGIVIVVYSVIVISTLADNVVKPLIIKFINDKLVTRQANISELAIFFAMIAGIASFGFWGVILGPAILTLFMALLKAFKAIDEI